MSRVIGSLSCLNDYSIASIRLRLFNYLELLESGFVDSESESRSVVIEIDIAVLRPGFTLKDVPEQFVAYFNIDNGKIFRHRRVQAGHHDVVVVHLAGMRNYGNGMRFCEGGNFAGLRDAAHAIGIKLDVIERMRLEQLTKSVKRELMFSARDRNTSVGLQLRVAMDVVGDHGLFQPSEMKRLQQRQHSLGVVEGPAHVSVSHDIDVVANGRPDSSHQLKIPLHATSAVGGSPSKAELHGLKPVLLVALRLGRELAQFNTVESGCVDRNASLRSAAEQAIDGLFGGFAQKIPQRDIHCADRGHADSLAAEGHGFAIHVLP